MKIVYKLIAVLGGLGILSSAAGSADAITMQERWKEAELECERALQEDTIEALEEYLRKYPFAPTACRALALNALSGFAPGGNPPNDGNPPGYTQ